MRVPIFALAAALFLVSPTLAEVPIDPGSTATIRLSPQGALVYPVAPKPPRAPANFGAILSVDIDEPGRYHVSLDAPGWIDVFRDGRTVAAIDYRPGEAGSGIAMIAEFELAPGHYKLALSGMAAGEARVAISR